MTTWHDINKILIELGKAKVDFNKEQINQTTHQQIERILMTPYLSDYQKRYLINELLAENNLANQMENRRKALFFIADFVNELTKDKQGK